MTQPEDLPTSRAITKSLGLRLLLVTVIAAILLTMLVYPFSQSGRQWKELFNLAHAPAFFAVLMFVAGLLDPHCIGLPKSWTGILPLDTARLMILAMLLMMMGVVCEVMQGFVGRLPSVSDVLANASGLCAGVFWCLSRKRNDHSGRIGLSLMAAGLLIGPGWSPIFELHDCYLQHQEFPRLASFERTAELHIWAGHEATIESSTAWATHGSTSLRVQGMAGVRYSGANFYEPVADWHEFTKLKLDLFNPGDKPITLSITICDTMHASSGWAAADRFFKAIELPPGVHVPVSVELAEVQSAPATRPMDLSRIASLNLFIVRPDEDFVLLVDNVRLADRVE